MNVKIHLVRFFFAFALLWNNRENSAPVKSCFRLIVVDFVDLWCYTDPPCKQCIRTSVILLCLMCFYKFDDFDFSMRNTSTGRTGRHWGLRRPVSAQACRGQSSSKAWKGWWTLSLWLATDRRVGIVQTGASKCPSWLKHLAVNRKCNLRFNI